MRDETQCCTSKLISDGVRIVTEFLDLSSHGATEDFCRAICVPGRESKASPKELLVRLQLFCCQRLELSGGVRVRRNDGAQCLKPLPTLQHPILERFAEGVVGIVQLVIDHDDAA